MEDSHRDLPVGVYACILSCMSFRDRCRLSSTCKLFQSLVASAAAHDTRQEIDSCELDVDMRLVADDEDDPLYRLVSCEAHPATPYARSLGVLLQDSGARLINSAKQLQHLCLLDPAPYAGQNNLCDQPAAVLSSLTRLTSLRSLHLATSGPLVDLAELPSGLQELQLEWFAAVSPRQVHHMCAQLASAAPRLKQLRRLTLSAELDTLLAKSSSAHAPDCGLNQLSALTKLTSVKVLRFQQPTPANADNPRHQGYTAVPVFLEQLPQLHHAELHLCSGHKADLRLLQHAEDVALHLTLEREEPTPFNMLPPSITLLTGLTSLVLTSAEFQSSASGAGVTAAASSSSSSSHGSSSSLHDLSRNSRVGPSMLVFDLSPLRHCPKLRYLLLELHGTPGRLHDVRGLQLLSSLKELILLFKCPALSSLRKLLIGSWPPAVVAAAAAQEQQAAAGCAAGTGSSGGSNSSSSRGSRGSSSSGARRGFLARLLSCFGDPSGDASAARVPPATAGAGRPQLLRTSDGSVSSEASSCAAKPIARVTLGTQHPGYAECPGDAKAPPPPCAEDVGLCRDIMACLRSFSPVFAAAVPPGVQNVVLATNSRMLLRAPHNLLCAESVGIIASQLHLQGAYTPPPPPAAAAGAAAAGAAAAGPPVHGASCHHSSSHQQLQESMAGASPRALSPTCSRGSLETPPPPSPRVAAAAAAAGTAGVEGGVDAAPASPRAAAAAAAVGGFSGPSSPRAAATALRAGVSSSPGPASPRAAAAAAMRAGGGLSPKCWCGGLSASQQPPDVAAAAWVDLVGQQGLVAQRHLQLLQSEVAAVHAAGGSCVNCSSLAISPAVAPNWHAARHEPELRMKYYQQQLPSSHWHHLPQQQAGGGWLWRLGGAWGEGSSVRDVLSEPAGVALWLQQQSGGRLTLQAPAMYPQLVAGAFAAVDTAAAGGVGGNGLGGTVLREVGQAGQWCEVDEEGDLVGRDVAPLVGIVNRAGVTGDVVVQRLLGVVERECFSYFA